MQLSPHFSLEELTRSTAARNLSIDNSPNKSELANLRLLAESVLEPLRQAFGKPIVVNSGFRCEALNKAVGGARSSQHMLGQAADIRTLSNTKEDNQALFETAASLVRSHSICVGQLIDEYGFSWVHISTPGKHVNNIIHIK
uniref:D-Ala-D-Ala carboxypeptidase family metallohydrolase n=1 Tax=Prevotella sp. TaxID=59823 RepID=UPI004027BC86